MFYELINVETGNLIGTYPTEAEALAVVRNAIRLNGLASIGGLALGCEVGDGEGIQIAEGVGLADRAVSDAGERRSLSA